MPQQQIGIGAAPNDGNGETARAAFTKVNANSTDAENRMAALEAVGATDDQTGAEIKVAYEGEANTNAFTDSEQTKLGGIEASATADQTGAEIKVAYEGETDTNAFSDAEQTKLGALDAAAAPDQTGAEIKVAYEGEANTNAFTDTEQTKLGGIEAAATADQTGAEIKLAYEGEANTNAFTDAEQTKLGGIETAATADQTGAEIKVAYEGEANTNAFTDAEQTKLGGIETAATADQTGAEIKVAYEGEANTNAFTDAEKSLVAGRASVVKSVDQVKISDPTIGADSELAFAMGAGETWLFSASIVADEGANNPNIKFRMGASGGLTGTIEYSIISEVEQEHLSDFTTVSGLFTLSTTKRTIKISGAVKTVLAGTLSVEWAQNITDTDPTTVYACSTLSAFKAT